MFFKFELATQNDDEALRRLARTTPVPGSISLIYQREPDFFRGCLSHGPFWQVLLARSSASGEVAGMAVRAVRDFWFDGEIVPIGYLGQLRVDPRFRGRWLVPAGFRFLRELVSDGRSLGQLTTVVEGNQEAERLLVEAPRGSLPRYRPITRILSFILPVGLGARREEPLAEAASPETCQEFHDFWRARSREVAMMPAVDLLEESLRGFPDLLREDVLATRKDGRITASLAVWDCGRFKQVAVHSYSPWLARLRPLANIVSALRGWPRLPEEGGPLKLAFGALLAAEPGQWEEARRVIRASLQRARQKSADFLVLAVDARDPLRRVLERFPHLTYPSRLFSVSWEDTDPVISRLGSRVVHVEPGTL